MAQDNEGSSDRQCVMISVRRQGCLNLNPAVQTAKYAKHAKGRWILRRRGFIQWVNWLKKNKLAANLFFSRSWCISRFISIAVFRFKAAKIIHRCMAENPSASRRIFQTTFRIGIIRILNLATKATAINRRGSKPRHWRERLVFIDVSDCRGAHGHPGWRWAGSL